MVNKRDVEELQGAVTSALRDGAFVKAIVNCAEGHVEKAGKLLVDLAKSGFSWGNGFRCDELEHLRAQAEGDYHTIVGFYKKYTTPSGERLLEKDLKRMEYFRKQMQGIYGAYCALSRINGSWAKD